MSDPKYSTPGKLGRGYTSPETGEKYIGVSTLIKWTNPKPGLIDWKVSQTAGIAAEMVDDAYTSDPDWSRSGPVRSLSEIQAEIIRRVEAASRVASHTGDVVHDWAAELPDSPDQPLPDTVPEKYQYADLSKVRRMCEHYRDFIKRWQFTVHYTERTVAHDVFGYAGSFDAIMSSPLLGPEWYVVDIKTTNGAKPREDVTYQLPLYAGAQVMWDPDTDTAVPMPVVSQERGYVIKVKEGGATLHRVEFRDPKHGLDMFAAISEAVRHFQWVQHGLKLVSEKMVHPLAPQPADVYDRIVMATSRDELTAVWSWAVSEGIWRDQHLSQTQQRLQEIEKGNV